MSDQPQLAPGQILSLPADLHAAIERALAAVPAARWQREAQALSERYRGPRVSGAPALATGAAQALGYTALIMPATYAQLRGALAAVAARLPGWAPQTLLDLGSGPGTALWAATAQWPSLRALTAWEREPAFLTLGRELARGADSAALRQARWERVDLQAEGAKRKAQSVQAQSDQAQSVQAQSAESKLLERSNARTLERSNASRLDRFDLVIIGHVLNELDRDARAGVLEEAWRLTGGLLLVVEPGTPEAFAVVRSARDTLLAQGARTVAPCAHDRPCPLEGDWCHFPQRLWRPDFQRRARGAPSQWEDAKFAYAAMARFPAEAPIWGRVIREPSFNKAYAEVTISSRAGVGRYRALKRRRELFKLVKDLPWGAALDELPPGPVESDILFPLQEEA